MFQCMQTYTYRQSTIGGHILMIKYFQDFVNVYKAQKIHTYLQKVNFKLQCHYLFILEGLAQNILFKLNFDNAQKFCILENKSPYVSL